jgi:two-component system, OmpR family, response regulator MprA
MEQSTILIVEDDDELKDLLKIRVESCGYHTIVVTNGDEALAVAQEQHPTVVILDIFLPDMDGLTVLKRMKAPIDIETGKPSDIKDIPVVVITGKAPMIENMTRVEGAADFFVKPIDIERLMSRLCELVEQGHK